MNERERPRTDTAGPAGGGTGTPDGQNVERIRRAGEEFYAAADAAIKSALSTNHATFLANSRQEGGQ